MPPLRARARSSSPPRAREERETVAPLRIRARSSSPTSALAPLARSPETLFTVACFGMLGMGVALPWLSLRSGVAFFGVRFGRQWFVLLYLSYYVAQLVVLVLQFLFDAKLDLIAGTRTAFSVRLILSLSVLVTTQIALPFVSGDAAAALGLGTLIGFFDGSCFGSASQLFSTHGASSSFAYFIGASLASVVAIGASYASGFAEISSKDLPADGTAPVPLGAFYYSMASATGLALAAVLCLLFSESGEAHLDFLDRELLEATPNSARSMRVLQKPRELAQRWGLEPEQFGGERNDSAVDASIATILKSTWHFHASIALLWLSSTLCDSLIAFQPGAADSTTQNDAAFKNHLLYSSLAGELCGKFSLSIVSTYCMRKDAGSAGGDEGRDGGRAPSSSSSVNSGVRAEALFSSKARGSAEEAEEPFLEGGGGDDADGVGVDSVPARSGRTSGQSWMLAGSFFFALCVARLFILAVPLLLHVLQPIIPGAPARAGGINGWWFNDGILLVLQATFDASGAFLSSLAYALAPLALSSSKAQTKNTALLSVTLTVGSLVGLAGSFVIGYNLRSS